MHSDRRPVALALLTVVVVALAVCLVGLTFRIRHLERHVALLRAVSGGMPRAEVERRLGGPGYEGRYPGVGKAFPEDAQDLKPVFYDSTGGLVGFDDVVVVYSEEDTVVGVFYPFYATGGGSTRHTETAQ